MHLTHDQISDFTALTLNNIKRRSYTDLSMEYPEYISPRILDKFLVSEQGGAYIEFKVKWRNQGNARHTGLFAQDQTGRRDMWITGKMPWRKQTTSISYDVDEEVFQTDRETIISYMVGLVHSLESDMVEMDEDDLWQAPASSTDDVPAGIPYWVVKDASTTPGGAFNGGRPSGHTTVADIDPTSTEGSNYKNWTFGYSSVTPTDLLKKVKKAIRWTNFRAPVPFPELKWGSQSKEIFTTEAVVDDLERLAEDRNDNLGKDVVRYMNQVTIAGLPVTHVFWLTSNDSSDPLYGINWSKLRPYGKRNRFMRRSKPIPAPRQHTVRDVFLDTWKNYGCVDRRCQWVGSKA